MYIKSNISIIILKYLSWPNLKSLAIFFYETQLAGIRELNLPYPSVLCFPLKFDNLCTIFRQPTFPLFSSFLNFGLNYCFFLELLQLPQLGISIRMFLLEWVSLLSPFYDDDLLVHSALGVFFHYKNKKESWYSACSLAL